MCRRQISKKGGRNGQVPGNFFLEKTIPFIVRIRLLIDNSVFVKHEIRLMKPVRDKDDRFSRYIIEDPVNLPMLFVL